MVEVPGYVSLINDSNCQARTQYRHIYGIKSIRTVIMNSRMQHRAIQFALFKVSAIEFPLRQHQATSEIHKRRWRFISHVTYSIIRYWRNSVIYNFWQVRLTGCLMLVHCTMHTRFWLYQVARRRIRQRLKTKERSYVILWIAL